MLPRSHKLIHNGQALTYVYFEDEHLTGELQRIHLRGTRPGGLNPMSPKVNGRGIENPGGGELDRTYQGLCARGAPEGVDGARKRYGLLRILVSKSPGRATLAGA